MVGQVDFEIVGEDVNNSIGKAVTGLFVVGYEVTKVDGIKVGSFNDPIEGDGKGISVGCIDGIVVGTSDAL
jgi:hypothetical protein